MIQTLSKVTEHQLDTLMDIWLTSNLQAHSFCSQSVLALA